MSLWTNVDEAAGKPKYLTTADKAVTFGVDAAEQTAETSQGVGPQHAGWVKRVSYTDAQGNVRTKLETLVAMGSMTSDLEDTVMQDLNIVIGTQPVDDSSPTGSEVVFTVAATTVPSGGTISYQWQVFDEAWMTAPGTANQATYTIADNTGLDGTQYRVQVSATGATTVTSNVVTVTEAA